MNDEKDKPSKSSGTICRYCPRVAAGLDCVCRVHDDNVRPTHRLYCYNEPFANQPEPKKPEFDALDLIRAI